MFARPVVVGLSGTTTPFSLVADSDVVAALLRAVREGRGGVFNLAGDGTLSLRQIAGLLGKPYLPLPPAVLKAALWLFNRSEERRVGKECVSTCRSRWSPYH